MKPNRRSRWKSVVVLATILTVGVTSACLLLFKAQKRQAFFSAVDPETGYRCRFTVSAGWHIDVPVIWDSWQDMGSNSFTAPPPGPIRRWCETHLWHRSTSTPTRIYLASSSLQNYPLGLNEGYPGRIAFLNNPPLIYRHLRIDGCPATLCQSEVKRGGKSIRATMLSIYSPASRTIYTIYGLPEISNSDQVYREVLEISESFHVEKVKGDRRR